MRIRALWRFYKDLFPIILVFTVLMKIIFGSFVAIFGFLFLGLFIGFLAFYLLKKQELYFYYNLGLDNYKLLKSALLFHLVIGLPIAVLLILILTLFFGGTGVI